MNAPGTGDAGFLAYICHESRNHRVPVSRLPTVCQGRPGGLPVLRAHQARLGISSPLITAGRARKASNTRVTFGKSSIPTSAPAS